MVTMRTKEKDIDAVIGVQIFRKAAREWSIRPQKPTHKAHSRLEAPAAKTGMKFPLTYGTTTGTKIKKDDGATK